jgi:hypothetical protein
VASYVVPYERTFASVSSAQDRSRLVLAAPSQSLVSLMAHRLSVPERSSGLTGLLVCMRGLDFAVEIVSQRGVIPHHVVADVKHFLQSFVLQGFLSIQHPAEQLDTFPR